MNTRTFVMTQEHKQKIGLSMKGKEPWNKGMIKEEIKEFISRNINNHLCKCGCGNFIIPNRHHYYMGVPSFIQGHKKHRELSEKYSTTNVKKIPNRPKGRGIFDITNPKGAVVHPVTASGGGICKNKLHSPIKIYHPKPSNLTKEKIKKFIEENNCKHICKCGCNTILPIKGIHYYTKIPSFIKGHNGRGHPCLEGTKGKIRQIKKEFYKNKENHPSYGKIRSTETRKKTSKSLIGKYIGKKHPNWQGGKSFEPYTFDFNKQFKEAIRERDNYCCLNCNKPQEEIKRKLDVHHIDYNKSNSIQQNCVSLCRPCHIPTNFNREIWIKHFQELLKKLYNYQYTEDQKIILDFTGHAGFTSIN